MTNLLSVPTRARSVLLVGIFQLTLGAAAPDATAAPNGRPSSRPSASAPKQSRPAQGRKPAKRAPAKKHVFLEKRVAATKNNLPNVQALGSLVIDLDSGRELFSRKPDQPRPIASISKLAASLVLVEKGLDLDGLTTMKEIDIEVAKGGAPSRLPKGMTLSNRDLLHAALLGSDNRAVSALGRAVGLSAGQFAEAMNKKMAQLGLKHTRFREPTGLSPENVSTPRELITLLRTAMANPVLGPVLKRCEYDAHPVSRPAIHYVNTHRPAHRANAEILGGKTGFNDAARYCLVLAERVDGHNYAMAFLGTEGKLTRFGDAARVADWIVVHKPKAGATLAKDPEEKAASDAKSVGSTAKSESSPDAGVEPLTTTAPKAASATQPGDGKKI